MSKALIICGPTASGKTDFAHKLARQHNGEIVNADSMQIYRQIPIITSSPSIDLRNEIHYHLYNFLDINESFSAIEYSKLAATKIRDISVRGKLPIIVGGSGLYIKTLIVGYNKIPDISLKTRDYVKNLYVEIGIAGIWNQLITLDPIAGSILNAGDTQRVFRAFEVIIQTGRSIYSFTKNDNFLPLPEFNFNILFLLPEREFLYNNCNTRVNFLLENGAIEEVITIKDFVAKANKPSFKALGIREIISWLDNKISRQEMVDLISLNTRRYAKRQITWFKNQILEKHTIRYNTQIEPENYGRFI